MNLPNKITITRLILSLIILIILIVPLNDFGLEFPKVLVGGKVLVDVKYIISGVLFIIASCTDFIDGHIARKYNLVTDFGKVMDAIADKVLVNGVLIILSATGFISVIVPVIIISRDTIVDSIKMVVGNKTGAVGASVTGKIKTIFMMIGISLMLFYNLPFELWNLRIADLLILTATVLSVVSGIEYYVKNKKYLFEK